MFRLIKFLIVLASTLALLLYGVFFYYHEEITQTLNQTISGEFHKATGNYISFSSLSFLPFKTIQLNDIEITKRNTSKPFIEIDEIDVSVNPMFLILNYELNLNDF